MNENDLAKTRYNFFVFFSFSLAALLVDLRKKVKWRQIIEFIGIYSSEN